MSRPPTLARDRLTWWTYGVLAAFAFILNGFGPLLDDLRRELDVSRTVGGLHSTALAVGMLIAGAGGERLRLRLGWTGVYWTACAGLLAGLVCLASAPTPALTLPSAVLIGATGTLLMVMVPGVLDARHGRAAGAAVAEAHATASLVSVIAPVAVGVSLALFGMWLPAMLLVALGVLPALGFFAPELPDAGSADGSQAAGRRLPPAYWRWWTALLFAVSAEFAVLLWAADDAHERLELGIGAAALCPSAFLLGMGAVRAFGAPLILTRSREGLFRSASLVAIGAFALYRVADTAPLAIAALVLVGIGVGMLYPLSLSGAMSAAPGLEAQASTRSALASGLAVGSGPLALGALADLSSVALASWIVVALLVAAIAASPFTTRRASRRPAPAET